VHAHKSCILRAKATQNARNYASGCIIRINKAKKDMFYRMVVYLHKFITGLITGTNQEAT
jgi:hypothetical protein